VFVDGLLADAAQSDPPVGSLFAADDGLHLTLDTSVLRAKSLSTIYGAMSTQRVFISSGTKTASAWFCEASKQNKMLPMEKAISARHSELALIPRRRPVNARSRSPRRTRAAGSDERKAIKRSAPECTTGHARGGTGRSTGPPRNSLATTAEHVHVGAARDAQRAAQLSTF
jgi:hypothetical protein